MKSESLYQKSGLTLWMPGEGQTPFLTRPGRSWVGPLLPLLLLLPFAAKAPGQAMIRVPTVNEGRPDASGNSQQLWFVVQTGPARSITDVDVSPDGRFAINAGDATPRVWKISTGEVIRELPGHRLPATVALFSSDGKFALTGGQDSYVRLWDWRAGRLVRSFGPHLREEGDAASHDTQPIALSSDGKTVMTTGLTEANESIVVLWNAETGEEVRRLAKSPRRFTAATMSPDARRVLTADASNEIAVWNSATGELIGTLKGHSQRVNALTISADNRLVASASDDQTALIWDAGAGRQLQLLAGHTQGVTDVDFSLDGKSVATSSGDSTARLWSLDTGQQVKEFRAGSDHLTAVAATPDGLQLLAGGKHRTLHRFHFGGAQPAQELRGFTTELTSAVIVREPARLVTGSPNAFRVWDLNVGHQIDHRVFDTQHVVISPAGRLAVSVDQLGKLTLHDVLSKHKGRSLPQFAGKFRAIHFAANDQQVIVVAEDGSVRSWDARSLELLRHWQQDVLKSGRTRTVASPSGRKLVSFDNWNGRVWSMADGKLLGEISARGHRIQQVVFAPDESLLVTSDEDSHVVWDGTTLAERTRIRTIERTVGPTAVSPHNRHLAVCDGEDIHLVELETGERLRTLAGHDEPTSSVVFTDDGKRLVTTSQDQTCRIWDVATGRQIALMSAFRSGGWVVVDDQARFDGSDGGEIEGIHWVIDDETISLHQLKNRYYEPQLLAKVLGFNGEPRREVAAFSTPKLFPLVEILPPVAERPSLSVHLKNRGGGIGRVVVKINGKEVTADARGGTIKPDAETADISLDLSEDPRVKPGEENLVEVIAYNQEGYLASRVRGVRVRAPARPQKPPPELWAVVAGVSDYRGEKIDLRYAAKDAEDFATALRLAARRLFGVEQVHLSLLSTDQQDPAGQPTRANIIEALKQAQSSRPSDVLVLYLSGHGVNHGAHDGDFYYLTADAEDAELTDPALRSATALSSEELADSIRQIPALKQVLILDTCASGRLVDKLTEHRSIPSSQIRAIERVKDRTGMHVLAGCAADAVSFEASRYGQGLLTHALLLGMRGAALREDQFVDVSGIFNFAADRVPELARDIGGIQRPTIASPKGGGSFDIGQITGEDRGEIPLQSPLPLVLRANFQDEIEFADTLSLSKLLDAQLRAVSSRGRSSPLVFVDAVQLPNAYRLFGRYEVTGDDVTVRVHLFQDKTRIDRFSVSGKRQRVEELATEIVRQSQQRLETNHPPLNGNRP